MNSTLEPPAIDTAETFAPLTSDAASAVLPASSPHTFQGQTLARLDAGTHMLVKNALVGIRGDELCGLTALMVLSDLQTGTDLYRQDGWDPDKRAKALPPEEAECAAIADVMDACQSVTMLQARVVQWRRSLSKKVVREGMTLVAATIPRV